VTKQIKTPTVNIPVGFLFSDGICNKASNTGFRALRRTGSIKNLANTEIGRITGRPDYLAVAATGRKWVTPSFILQASPPPPVDDSGNGREVTAPARVGFTVSKKVGNAVKRSRARRRLKEAARICFPEKAPAGWDYVIIGRAAAIDYPFEKMGADMRWALAKLSSNTDLKASNRDRKPTSVAASKR